MKYVLKDPEEIIISEFRITKLNDASIKGEVLNPIAWSDHKPCEYDYFADVVIKWDGCSHFWFKGEDYLNTKKEDCYYHVCGGHCYLNFIVTMAFITEVAKREIEGYQEYIADFNLVKNLDLLKGYTIKKIEE